MTTLNPAELVPLLPALIVAATGLAVLLIAAFGSGAAGNRFTAHLSLFGLAAALIVAGGLWTGSDPAVTVLRGQFKPDRFALFFAMLSLAAGAFSILLAAAHLEEQGEQRGEFHALLLFATAGMLVMAGSADLVSLFLGLELMSVSVYVLAGYFRARAESTEAAMKYFIMGAFSTGFLVMGIAYLYGAAGATGLDDIRAHLTARGAGDLFATIGVGLVLIGFLFKVAAVPFHMWVPDVYQGSPTGVTVFMAVGVKAAAFAAFVRLLLAALPAYAPGPVGWGWLLAIVSVATMTVGNLLALRQTDIKRMLACSSIAHAGYLLAGVAVMGATGGPGAQAVLWYLVAYSLMNSGAFGVVVAAGSRTDERLAIPAWAGFGYRRPMLGAAMALFMLALAGIPPTGGFFGKFLLFKAAVSEGWLWLAVAGVANSLLSVYYYLRIIIQMYMREPEGGSPDFGRGRPEIGFALAVAAAGVLLLGLFPDALLAIAAQAVESVF